MGSEGEQTGAGGEASFAGAASGPSELEPLTSEELAAIRGAQSVWCKNQHKFEGSDRADHELFDSGERALTPPCGTRIGPAPLRSERALVGASIELRLYLAGSSPTSIGVLRNVRAAIEEDGARSYLLEVVDVSREPQRAVEDGVLTAPALVRVFPEPARTFVGDLSDISVVSRILEAAGRAPPARGSEHASWQPDEVKTKNHRLPRCARSS